MTPREKKTALVVFGAVGLLGGWRLVQSGILAPRADLIKQIHAQEQRADWLAMRLKKKADWRDEWHEQTRRTLPGTPTEIQSELRRRIGELMDKHHLALGRQITPMSVRMVQKPPGKDFVEIGVRVQTEAPLKEISNFLHDLHELPFFVRVDKLTLHPQQADVTQARKSDPAKKSGKSTSLPDGPKLQTTVELTTLSLPKLPDDSHPTFDAGKPVDVPKRLEFDAPAYAAMVAKNPFKVYEAPVIVTAATKPAEDTKVVKASPPPPPPPNPRPDADKLTLVAVESLHGQPIAYVKHETKLEPPKEFRLNEVIDDGGEGKLVLVDPRGIVVRVQSAKSPGEPSKYYFYPLGSKFSEREELSATDHVDIYRLLGSVVNLAKT